MNSRKVTVSSRCILKVAYRRRHYSLVKLTVITSEVRPALRVGSRAPRQRNARLITLESWRKDVKDVNRVFATSLGTYMYVPRTVVDASHPPRGSSNDWWAHGHSVPKPTFISELGVRRPYGFNRLHAGQSERRSLARFQNSVVLRTSQDPGPMH
ncbi:conserved hypothetical protein [Coccidioides posadasii str. Silveira]|uniref:Uncharacterized protein n=1 Tax=Coccidioides posadasii (strain RMSCC 757 / Silveira) TaxID=443226 RepID=E9CXM8_COCPS|nr:conserved hypothetical protein [Coccidioides posadasii str. Silveira]